MLTRLNRAKLRFHPMIADEAEEEFLLGCYLRVGDVQDNLKKMKDRKMQISQGLSRERVERGGMLPTITVPAKGHRKADTVVWMETRSDKAVQVRCRSCYSCVHRFA